MSALQWLRTMNRDRFRRAVGMRSLEVSLRRPIWRRFRLVTPEVENEKLWLASGYK